MSAAIVKSTTLCLPILESVELTSCTFVRSGTTCRRESRRATPSCEYVRPEMVNSEGVPTPVELEAFVAGEIGDLALSSVSQTSSGRTSENSRKTRSHETRLARAAVKAVTRALCSPARACSAAHADADPPLERAGRTRQVRRAAREGDLADAQRAGLVLVVLQRGDELAREGLDGAAHRVPCLLGLFGRQALRHHFVCQCERA